MPTPIHFCLDTKVNLMTTAVASAATNHVGAAMLESRHAVRVRRHGGPDEHAGGLASRHNRRVPVDGGIM